MQFAEISKGYGNNAPATRIGRLFCCFFVIVGLPYFAYMVSVISDLIHSILNRVSQRLKERVKANTVCNRGP